MRFIRERNAKLLDDLRNLIYHDECRISSFRYRRGTEGVGEAGNLTAEGIFEAAFSSDSDWSDFSAEEVWGGDHEYFLFAADIRIPDYMIGKSVVFQMKTGREGEWDALNPQFLAYVDGKKRQGLDVNHRELLLADCAETGEKHALLLSAYTGDRLFHLLMEAELCILEKEIEKLYYDIKVPFEAARLMKTDSEDYMVILDAVTEAFNEIDFREPYSEDFFESIGRAQKVMDRFYREKCGGSRQTVYAVGHSHIDLAWQWTLAVTRDKTVRSFSTVLEYMRLYPEYCFMASQPQEYKYVKQLAPEIYSEIQRRAEEGRWEPEGAMYVEADCNLTAGESLVRQIIHGKRFFKEEFGADSVILWLPDVFGYSAALPQIMAKSGIRYFMTTKISWNETNMLPYDTFMWQGIDGTRVLTHFAPTRDYNKPAEEGSAENEHFTTYNGILNPSQVLGGWQRYNQKELNKEVLMCYGYGDGGGGPTREMLEQGERLSRGIPGIPRVRQTTALDFFENLERHVSGDPELPEWNGELYLEYHRGTYTSMAKNKKLNRRAEYALMNAEHAVVLAALTAGTVIPRQRLYDDWDVVLRNQFHDIIPGSSIKDVYIESQAELEAVTADAEKMTADALDAVFKNTSHNSDDSDRNDGKADAPGFGTGSGLTDKNTGETEALYAVNFNGFDADALVEQEADEQLEEVIRKRRLFFQKAADGKILIPVSQVPSKGFCEVQTEAVQNDWGGAEENLSGHMGKVSAEDRDAGSVRISVKGIETPDLRIVIAENGHLTSIFDRTAERELLPEAEEANVLMTYEDRPHNFDNWDINNYYKAKAWPVDEVLGISVEENGPLRYAVRIEYRYLSSRIVQHIYAYPRGTRFDIRTEIDWKEKQILLKNWFPADIHANEASYEIQFGNVTRPTHYNTSWDEARFEVCSHKWVDLSEDGYGLSVLNDCKYGSDIHNGRIGLTLLKSGIFPNPDADKEYHVFTYAFCLHREGWREAGTEKQAVLFNNPPKLVIHQAGAERFSLIRPEKTDGTHTPEEGIVLETVKPSLDGDAVILRAYEYQNRRTPVHFEFGLPVSSVQETDLLETAAGEVQLTEGGFDVQFRPYEIRTFRVEFLKH